MERIALEPMYLKDLESHADPGPYGERIRQAKVANLPIPQIWHLFAFKPDRTEHLAEFTQGVMRGPSPLSPGQRELIAAFTSRKNKCPY